MKKNIKTFLSIALIIASMSSMTTVFATDMESAVSLWAENEYSDASLNGFLTYDLVKEDLRSTITEDEFYELIEKLKHEINPDSNKNVEKTAIEEIMEEAKEKNTELSSPKKEAVQKLENLHSSSVVTTKIEEIKDKEFFKVPDITREEMITILIEELTPLTKAITVPENTDIIKGYIDWEEITSEHRSAFAIALENDLINGLYEGEERGILSPQSKATREQAIAIINRCYNLIQVEREKYQLTIALSSTSDETVKKNSLINFTIDESGDIDLEGIDGAEYYSIIVKDSQRKAIFEKNFERLKDATIETDLEKNEIYTVIIGVKLKNDDEQYSLPISFEYKGDYAIGERIVEEVKKYLGVRYVWGGTSPRGFDCSGLTQYVCNSVGIKIVRTADDQWRNSGTHVSRNELQPGDLVYFGSGNHATHTGVYVGDGQMIHAPQTGDVVKYANIDGSYFGPRFLGGKRVY